METAKIRSVFLDFFKERGHKIESSSPIVPQNDPSLFFVNSGMVQFKNVFTGKEKRDYTRATTCQKCVRASGKHNDLEQVGYTARHHTFFEMLGNFSFGDYFKEEAISMAWNLLTKVLPIDKSRLVITVYHTDDEAYSLWKKIAGLHDEQIIKIATSDNFWSMGDTGPCGPSSEIFYDHGDHIKGGKPGSPDQDGDRFVEIWNLVFMQFDQISRDERVPLPKPSIDTGMGIERLAAVLQGTHDNFKTDIFKAIIESSASISGHTEDGEYKFSHRIIADHLRSIAFLVADGITPSNEGRGYILRRILRRALRHSKQISSDPYFMTKLFPTLCDKMSGFYSEISRASALIINTIEQESDKFQDLLIRGIPILEKYISEISTGEMFPGKHIFNMYDTYGFPIDIIHDELASKGIKADESGFQELMEKQKEESRKAWCGSGAASDDARYLDLSCTLNPTEFIGHEMHECDASVLSVLGDEIVTNKTPFYAQSGGQMYDTGSIKGPHGTMHVESVTKCSGLFVHRGPVNGYFETGETVHMAIDYNRRKYIMANHSSAHLLQAALRKVLGDHVAQKGSSVTEERLRFDFSHGKSMTAHEISEVENIINEKIRENTEVIAKEMSQKEAMAIGATALFGEKYGATVRVISMGNDFSTELCGGTHARRTGDIGIFKIVSESSLASGVRRIEALAGGAAVTLFQQDHMILGGVSHILNTSKENIAEKISQIISDNKSLKKSLEKNPQEMAARTKNVSRETFSGIDLYVMHVKDQSQQALLSLMDDMKKKPGIIVITNVMNEKLAVLMGVSGHNNINAAKLLNDVIHLCGGTKAGGRSDMAQGGGITPSGINDMIDEIKRRLLNV